MPLVAVSLGDASAMPYIAASFRNGGQGFKEVEVLSVQARFIIDATL
jgi:hypothetical protein